MASATNQSGYGGSGVGASPWGTGPAWNTTPPQWAYWHWRSGNRGIWIVATILGFIFWWPLGLILLFCTLGGRHMGCWGYGRHDGYGAGWQSDAPPPPWVGWKRHWKRQMRDWCSAQPQGRAYAAQQPSSGNRAFDEYRAETLRRLEDEQKEFGEFLDRLRFAKDKSEFDQFMTERRNRPPAPPEPPPGAPGPV